MAESEQSVQGVPAFAVVDGESLDAGIFMRRVLTDMRKTFYHGSVPAAEANPFRQKIADLLVDEYLLSREARSRGLSVDADQLEEKWRALDEQNGSNPEWLEAKSRLKPIFEADWRRELLAAQLVALERESVAEPSHEDVLAFYSEHPELFTEPESHRISIILLGVDPSGGEAAWQDAEARADGLYQQLLDGADFAEFAQLHSTDVTADQGGDMGVVHKGMVGDDVQELVESMSPGDISKPMRLLQGVALFRLDQRTEPVRHPFEAVRERAKRLYLREQVDLAEEMLRFTLRQGAEVKLDDSVILLPDGR